MPRLTISANAQVFRGDPRRGEEVVEATELQLLHGIHSDDTCCEFFEPDFVKRLTIAGGRVRFYFDVKLQQLRVSSTFDVKERPSDSDIRSLAELTVQAWDEGIGQGVFSLLDKHAPSARLLTMILTDHSDFEIPEFCVDACPDNQEEALVKWSESGHSDDELIADLEQLVAEGNLEAKAELGRLLVEPEGVPGRREEGVALLKETANKGNEWGLVHYGSLFLKSEAEKADVDEVVAVFEKAIDGGSLLAMSMLGEAYKEGKGVDKDLERALPLLQKAAESGFPIAMAEFGDCYEFGIGLPQDLRKALSWYKQSLEAGFEDVEPAFKRVQSQIKRSNGFFGYLKQAVVSLVTNRKQMQTVDDNFTMVHQDDPEMEAAVAKAQGTLKEFIEQLNGLSPNESAALKVRFQEGETVEHMWITDVRFDSGHFYGDLNNDPELLTKMECGDPQKVHPNDVNDWMITDTSGNYRGGFTVDLLTRRARGG